jgi:hypothetical protein
MSRFQEELREQALAKDAALRERTGAGGSQPGEEA